MVICLTTKITNGLFINNRIGKLITMIKKKLFLLNKNGYKSWLFTNNPKLDFFLVSSNYKVFFVNNGNSENWLFSTKLVISLI